MKLKFKNQDFQEAATAASVVAWLVALYHELLSLHGGGEVYARSAMGRTVGGASALSCAHCVRECEG
ncbi:MAG: hypothetical protein IKJ45_15695 [Kiritimatiellae bacterium]|nr:hypothetical protein [Kiritimatiellia bacterium]